MIDPELLAKLDAIEAKAEAAYVAADKARKYLFWTGVVSIAFIVLPMIGLVFAIPMFMQNYIAPMQALTSGNAGTAPLGNTSGSGSLSGTIKELNALGL